MKVNTTTSQRRQAGTRRRKHLAKKGHLPPINCLGYPGAGHGGHGWTKAERQTLIAKVDRAKITLHVCSKCEKEINTEISDGLKKYYEEHKGA